MRDAIYQDDKLPLKDHSLLPHHAQLLLQGSRIIVGINFMRVFLLFASQGAFHELMPPPFSIKLGDTLVHEPHLMVAKKKVLNDKESTSDSYSRQKVDEVFDAISLGT